MAWAAPTTQNLEDQMPPELVVILYLVVRDLHVLHGQQSQLLSSLRVAAVLHVPRDREQLG